MAFFVALWVIGAILFGGYFLLSVDDLEEVQDITPAPEMEDPQQSRGEIGRSEAYAAMRAQANKAIVIPDASVLYWRDNTHSVTNGLYQFDGFLDVQYFNGTMRRFPYTSVGGFDADGLWHLQGVRVGPQEFEPDTSYLAQDP